MNVLDLMDLFGPITGPACCPQTLLVGFRGKTTNLDTCNFGGKIPHRMSVVTCLREAICRTVPVMSATSVKSATSRNVGNIRNVRKVRNSCNARNVRNSRNARNVRNSRNVS